MKTESRAPTAGAMRAAKSIEGTLGIAGRPIWLENTAEIIDRETGCREMAEALKAAQARIEFTDYETALEIIRAALEKAGQ